MINKRIGQSIHSPCKSGRLQGLGMLTEVGTCRADDAGGKDDSSSRNLTFGSIFRTTHHHHRLLLRDGKVALEFGLL